MTKPFDVLDRSQNLHKHHLIEASAGTGKTFSIQNLVARLLMEDRKDGQPITLDKILVVTFTRMATRELKIRIRRNIEDAIRLLSGDPALKGRVFQNKDLAGVQAPAKCPSKSRALRPGFDLLDKGINASGKIPDYLKSCIEQGESAVRIAKKRLQQALFLFDQAQIFTIHAFCARMLKQYALENYSKDGAISSDQPISHTELRTVVRDFFRTELKEGVLSPSQMEIYLKGDGEQEKLIKMIQSSHEFVQSPTFSEVYHQFNKIMKELKEKNGLASHKMIEDFEKQAPFYSNYGKENKAQTSEKIALFAQLFDKEDWSEEDLDYLIAEGIIWTKALNSRLLKKHHPPNPNELHFSDLTAQFAAELSPMVDAAGNFSLLLARLASDCRRYLTRYQREENKFSLDAILRRMHQALRQPLFVNHIRKHYEAVIVDEFQDTDPLQWSIFGQLFPLDKSIWQGNLYLVGDPKQSIYSFRQADIYTYLSAADAIGQESHVSLNVNYRSQRPLVEALNHLFSKEILPSFIPLPKLSLDLSCPPVQASREGAIVDGERGAVHFFVADCRAFKKASLQQLESEIFFPFIGNEIIRLKKMKGLLYHQFSVLVRDRMQAARLIEFFSKAKIPFLNQRGSSLADSSALVDLCDLFQALLQPRHRGKALAAMGTPLFGWTEEEVRLPEMADFALLLIQKLATSLREKEFALFFREFLQTKCKPNGQTVIVQLLSKKEGIDYLRDVQQIADTLSEHHFIEWHGPEGILPFLDRFDRWKENDDTRAQRFVDPHKEGVRILTLHMSKGLEFDVVFALGLVNREGIREDLFPIERDGRTILSSLPEDSADYLRHCEELDAEKMRQLYVALTRAKHLLYIPAAISLPSENLKFGGASPIDLYLARFKQSAHTYQKLYDQIRSQDFHSFLKFVEEEGAHHLITVSKHQKVSGLKNDAEADPVPILNAPQPVYVPGKPMRMVSYSSLTYHGERTSGEKLHPPSDLMCAAKDIHTLPSSIETGLLVHSILEKILFSDFRCINSIEEALPFIRPFLTHTSFKEWEEVIAQMILNALKVPILPSIPFFSFSMLEPGYFYREMSFLHPFTKGKVTAESSDQESLIKGVIDLLFYHEGYYYLVDWKTNWLGPDYPFYEKNLLQTAMYDNGYFLQASLYAEAVHKYLKLVEERPFDQCFGGIYYLFLRGIQPGGQTGIFHFLPTEIGE